MSTSAFLKREIGPKTGPRARGYKVGTRLEVGDRLDLNVEGRRSVRADGDAGNEVMIYGHARW